jgi:hypothetical protein
MVMPKTLEEKGRESLFLFALPFRDAACLLTSLPKQRAAGPKIGFGTYLLGRSLLRVND